MNMTGKVMVILLTLTLVLSTLRAQAGVALGATRVIYPAGQKQISLGVSLSLIHI